jgi:hypothetical protein
VLGADATGRPIVIENRLEATDHNQLGQMIVHASGWTRPWSSGSRPGSTRSSGAAWTGSTTAPTRRSTSSGWRSAWSASARPCPRPCSTWSCSPATGAPPGRRQVRLPVDASFPGGGPSGGRRLQGRGLPGRATLPNPPTGPPRPTCRPRRRCPCAPPGAAALGPARAAALP